MSNESPARRKACHQTFNLVVWLKTSYSCKKLCHNEDDLGENFLLLQEDFQLLQKIVWVKIDNKNETEGPLPASYSFVHKMIL